MAIKSYRPTTPAQRGKTTQDFDQITTSKPMKSLLKAKKQQAGKNNQGRITVRHRGGGVKRHYRLLTHNLPKDLKLTVMEIEYKPAEFNMDYDIVNNPDKFELYVDGELVEI